MPITVSKLLVHIPLSPPAPAAGVVHVINAVLLPNPAELSAKVAAWSASKKIRGSNKVAALPNLVQLAESVPQLSTLVAAVTAGGLVQTLEGTGPFT